MSKRWKMPRYKAVGRSASSVADDYAKLAAHYERLAKDDRAFNEQRKREGKPIVKAVKDSERRHLRRAKQLRERAKRHRGVFSRDRRSRVSRRRSRR
jgi:putative protein kinase ArgK-like GTPase of G3E family